MKFSLFINKTYSRNQLLGMLEALLFVNGKPMTYNELCEIFDVSKDDIDGFVKELNEIYKNRNAGFKIISVANGYQLMTSPEYYEELKEIFGKRNENEIPKSAMETLAIIAYKQPITKEEIDRIRGVSSIRSINTLLAMKLINISGTSDDILKSPLYVTTEKFLELFKLNSLNDLPSINSIDISNYFDESENNDNTEEDDNINDNKNKSLFDSKGEKEL